MDSEMKSPEGKTMVGSICVFKKKANVEGQVEGYKARLVAQGFTQRQGLNYYETYYEVQS